MFDVQEENRAKEQVILHVDKLPLYFLCFFVDIFTRSFDDLISMKFLITVFLLASPFINFGDFCQPPRLLHPPRLLFWPKFATLLVYSALAFCLKLESTLKILRF